VAERQVEFTDLERLLLLLLLFLLLVLLLVVLFVVSEADGRREDNRHGNEDEERGTIHGWNSRQRRCGCDQFASYKEDVETQRNKLPMSSVPKAWWNSMSAPG